MPRSRPRRRKAATQVRREAGYAIIEAMPPLIACAFLGVVIAAGLMIQAPATGGDSSARSTDHQAAQPEPDLSDNDGPSGFDDRPTPGSAEGRYAFVTRTYEDRLAASGARTGTAFHGVPGSDFTGNGNPDILVTKPRATNLVDGSDPTGGYGSVEIWTLWSASAVMTIDGPFQNDLFALSAKSAGDLDGDGADDLIIGAMLDDGDSGAVPHPVGEEKEITLDRIFEWYLFLLNEDDPDPGNAPNAAIELLADFERNDGVVLLEDIDQSYWEQLPFTSDQKSEIDPNPGLAGHAGIIRIDPRHVDDNAEAAQLLYESLLEIHSAGHFRDQLPVQGPGFAAFQANLKDRWNRVAATASAGANLYIEGVSLFLPGADWGLLLNDVLEGDIGWEAAINFLPFAKAALKNKSSRSRIRICPSGSIRFGDECNGFAFDADLCGK